jgi:hypothetical protein
VIHIFVSWWVGPENFGGGVLTALLVAQMTIRHWNVTLVYSLFSFGHERHLSFITLADGVVTVCLGILLVGALGPAGAPMGAVIAALVVSVPANLKVLATALSLPVRSVLEPLLPVAFRYALVITVAALISRVSNNVPGMAGVLITSIAAVILYISVFLPFIRTSPVGAYVRTCLQPVRDWMAKAA